MCNGLETRLFECPHAGLEMSRCGHDQDAGIVCMAGKKLPNQAIVIRFSSEICELLMAINDIT